MLNRQKYIKRYEINGDLKISFLKALAWFALNIIRNFRFSECERTSKTFYANRNICKFNIDISSPGRTLVTLFNQLNLNSFLKKEHPPSCLEIGCGSGSFYESIKLKSVRANYTGIDLYSRFQKRVSSKCRFIKMDILIFRPNEKYDFIYSNSVLEHCKDDHMIFKKSYEWLKEGGTALHFLPAASGVLLYPKHGFRQYTIYSLKNKVPCKDFSIYQLGGFGSFLVHLIFITVPEGFFRFPARKFCGRFYSIVKELGFRLDPILPFFGPMVAVVLKKNGARR